MPRLAIAFIFPVATSIMIQVPCSAWLAVSSFRSAFSAMSWIFTSTVVTMSFPFLRLDLIPFHGDIGPAADVAYETPAGLSFQQGIIGAFQAYVLYIRSCQANGTIGQQAERIQSFYVDFRDEAALITNPGGRGEIAEPLIFFERDVGLQEVVAVFCAVALQQVSAILVGRLIAEEGGEAMRKGVEVFGDLVRPFHGGHRRQSRSRC